MNGQNNQSLPTKSQKERHHNSTSSPNQNGYEMAPWAIYVGQCFKVSATKSIHSLASQGQVQLCVLFQTAPAECLQKEHSWSNYSDCSSVVHFFIIAQHGGKD